MTTERVTAPPSVVTPAGGEHSGGRHITQANLSIIIFIGSEIALFASFFMAYFFVRFNIAEQWPPLNEQGVPFELPVLLTLVNTCFLVFSSFTVWWGEKRFAAGDRKGLERGLLVTILLGATFLGIQANEYAHLGFTPQDKAFGSVFYCLTGLHGLHVLLGLTILGFVYRRARRGDFSPQAHGPLSAASIYWHFVDVVWVLLFILVYLV
jgi:cytochrome c oxidase subunit 3